MGAGCDRLTIPRAITGVQRAVPSPSTVARREHRRARPRLAASLFARPVLDGPCRASLKPALRRLRNNVYLANLSAGSTVLWPVVVLEAAGAPSIYEALAASERSLGTAAE